MMMMMVVVMDKQQPQFWHAHHILVGSSTHHPTSERFLHKLNISLMISPHFLELWRVLLLLVVLTPYYCTSTYLNHAANELVVQLRHQSLLLRHLAAGRLLVRVKANL